MRRLAMLFAALASVNVSAYEIDTEACAGVEHIYNQQGFVVPYDPAIHTFVTAETPVFYAGKELIPHFWVGGARGANIAITNTSDSIVSFFFKPTYYSDASGAETVYGSETLFGSFNAANDPRDGAGSTMQPNTTGRITAYSGSSQILTAHAEILWDSSNCLAEPPMLTFVENYYSPSSSRIHATTFNVNQGRKW